MTTLTLVQIWLAIIVLTGIGAFCYCIREIYIHYRRWPKGMATYTKPMRDHRRWIEEFNKSLKP